MIAVFDFDGTLIAKDSFVTLLKQSFKSQPWRCLLLVLFCPILIVTLIFKLDRTLSKSVVLWCATVFKNKRRSIKFLTQALQTPCQKLWFEEGIQKLNELYNSNVEIVIATASGQIWVRSLLRSKFKKSKLIIGTKLKFFAGGVVLASKNCRDQEKLVRIRAQLGHDFVWHSSWSDHIADIPILQKARERYIICPKQKHVILFKKALGENMQILNWKTIQ